MKTERLLSPKGTLKTASWGAANGTQGTPRKLREAAEKRPKGNTYNIIVNSKLGLGGTIGRPKNPRTVVGLEDNFDQI